MSTIALFLWYGGLCVCVDVVAVLADIKSFRSVCSASRTRAWLFIDFTDSRLTYFTIKSFVIYLHTVSLAYSQFRGRFLDVIFYVSRLKIGLNSNIFTSMYNITGTYQFNCAIFYFNLFNMNCTSYKQKVFSLNSEKA